MLKIFFFFFFCSNGLFFSHEAIVSLRSGVGPASPGWCFFCGFFQCMWSVRSTGLAGPCIFDVLEGGQA